MSPPSFFAPYSPIGQSQFSFQSHMPVRPNPSQLSAAATMARGTVPRPSPQRPHDPPLLPPPGDNLGSPAAQLGPVPRPGPPRPHWPPPFVTPGDGTAPAYTASAPPPAYSSMPLECEKCQLLADDLTIDDDYAEEIPRSKVRDVVVLILIAMNVGVWGLVFWYWIHDGLAGQLYEEVQGGRRLDLRL